MSQTITQTTEHAEVTVQPVQGEEHLVLTLRPRNAGASAPAKQYKITKNMQRTIASFNKQSQYWFHKAACQAKNVQELIAILDAVEADQISMIRANKAATLSGMTAMSAKKLEGGF